MQTIKHEIGVSRCFSNLVLKFTSSVQHDAGDVKCRNLNSSYLAKMHLIKNNLIRMPDAPEPCDESQNCDNCKSYFVVPF